MTEFLRILSSLSILVFAVSSMLSAGLSFTVRDIVAPLREPNRVARALVGNFVLVPLLAVGVARALSLDPAPALGLILLGSAAGAPFLIKLIAVAAGDIAMGTALLVLLVPMTVVFMPLVVPLLAPDAAVDAGAIAVPLALSMLVPLAIGLLVTERATRWANRLQPIAGRVSTVALVVVLGTTLLAYAGDVRDVVASRAAVAVLLFVFGAFVIGYVIASPHPERRVVLGLGTAQRNIAAATIVAAQNVGVPATLAPTSANSLVLVIVASVLELAVLFPLARWLRGRARRTSAGVTESDLAASRA
jgi:BASS family bile acid:Na+ symporter